MGDDRFEDAGEDVMHFASEVWLVCPRCGRRAVARQVGEPGWQSLEARAACAHCAWTDHVADRFGTQTEGHDPWFDEPLWLQLPFRGHVLWALNPDHLAFLRDFVAARLRRRDPDYHHSIVTRAPKWMKSAKNRDALARAFAQLEERAADD